MLKNFLCKVHNNFSSKPTNSQSVPVTLDPHSGARLPLLLLMLAARFKLATLVQYVPLPVVGGYLGYVGYFCLAAGIGLGCNTTINTFTSWGNLCNHGEV